MVVELLCCALTGAAFGFEADSFFEDAGNQPRLARRCWWWTPARWPADAFAARIETSSPP